MKKSQLLLPNIRWEFKKDLCYWRAFLIERVFGKGETLRSSWT